MMMPESKEERHSFVQLKELPVIIRYMRYFLMKYAFV